MIFDLNKFKYIHVTKGDVQEIIALAKYKGKTFRGVARCHPSDTYDKAIGEELAARRCDLAIRRARLKDRRELASFYNKIAENAQKNANYAQTKYETAFDELIAAHNIYEELIAQTEERNA